MMMISRMQMTSKKDLKMKTTTILISPQSEDDLKNEKKIENEKLKMKPKLKMT